MNLRGLAIGCLMMSACSSTPEATEPAATASVEPAASAEPAPAQTASAEPVPAASASVAASAASAPVTKSSYTIGGKSLSDVDFATLQSEVKKAGYELPGPPSINVCGKLEITQLGLGKKGKSAGIMALHRPAAKPTTDCTPTSNKESLAAWQKGIDDPKGTTAFVFDEQADVLLMVNLMSENKAAAKKLIESLAKKP